MMRTIIFLILVSIATLSYAQEAILTYSNESDTQIAIQNWEKGDVKQKFAFKIGTSQSFYHPASKKVIFFNDKTNDFYVYDSNTNVMLKSQLTQNLDMHGFLKKSDLFLAQDKISNNLLLLRFSSSPTPIFTTEKEITFHSKITSVFVGSDDNIYLLSGGNLSFLNPTKDDAAQKLHDFQEQNIKKIIAVLMDNSIFLQSSDKYFHFDLNTKQIKDVKNGYLNIAETPEILFLAHKGNQNKITIIEKANRQVRFNSLKNLPIKVVFTPNYKNIYYISTKSLKLFHFKDNKLLNKISLSKNPGTINIFFLD
jgi:hypothetical protein